jgi:ribonuclease HI
MELTAPIRALTALTRACVVDLHTDSTYVRNGIMSWMANWKRNGWRTKEGQPVKNEDLWRELDAAVARHDEVVWHWVKGHAGHVDNERADRLAARGQREALQAAGVPVSPLPASRRQAAARVTVTGDEAHFEDFHLFAIPASLFGDDTHRRPKVSGQLVNNACNNHRAHAKLLTVYSGRTPCQISGTPKGMHGMGRTPRARQLRAIDRAPQVRSLPCPHPEHPANAKRQHRTTKYGGDHGQPPRRVGLAGQASSTACPARGRH